MEEINEWKVLTLESFGKMANGFASTIPNIIGATVVLVLGWFITRIVEFLLKRLLRLTQIDEFTKRIGSMDLFGGVNVEFKVSRVIVGFVKWIMFLLFLIIASDIMNWEIVSEEIGNLLQYLPKLFSAVALFMIGLYIADFIKKSIKGLFGSFDLSGSKIISKLVFYFITILITIAALNQAGVDTTVITNNFSIILGAFLLAMSIGFGLGSKEVIGDLLRTYYARRNFKVGDKIKIDNIKGVVLTIDNMSLTIRTGAGKRKMIIPIKDVMNSNVEVQ